MTDLSDFVQVDSWISGTCVFFNDFPDDGGINVLLNNVDQLALVELGGLTVGLEFDDSFVNQHSSLFDLLSCPVFLIGRSEQFF